MVEIYNLTKHYAKNPAPAVCDLNLQIGGGEIFGFLGPNGAGKTTTIKIITGILPFTQGVVRICGSDLNHDPISAKRNIGYVPDNHSVYEKLTGREYVNFLADVYNVDSFTRAQRCDSLVERFGLKDAFNSQIRTYSHGMKQKIAVIGALIHDPKIWVLDEPMTGLDPQSSFELKALMQEHCNRGNVVFFSTHILEVAEKICDRIGIISGGRLIMCGNLKEIRAAREDSSLEQIFLSVTNTGGGTFTGVSPAPFNGGGAQTP